MRTRDHHRTRGRQGVIIGLALFVAVELALRLAEPLLPEPSMWPNNEMAFKVDQIDDLVSAGIRVDTVFAGSSVAAEGFDPVAFNEVGPHLAYNAALGAASARSLERWLLDVVVPRLDPEVVVVGLVSRDLNDGGISQREFYERVASSHGLMTVGAAANPMEAFESWLVQHVSLFRLRPLVRDPAQLAAAIRGEANMGDDPKPGPFGSDPEDPGSGSYDNSEVFREFWRGRQLNGYSIGADETEALERLVAELAERGVSVVLVHMPVTEDYVSLLPDPDRDPREFRDLLIRVAEEQGAVFVDADPLFERDDFRDPAHLDPRAAAELARALAADFDTLIRRGSDLQTLSTNSAREPTS